MQDPLPEETKLSKKDKKIEIITRRKLNLEDP